MKSYDFEELCKKYITPRQNTTPYTAQHDGVIERMNKMLMEMVRSMLIGARLS